MVVKSLALEEPNLYPLLCLELFKKFVVGWWWVVGTKVNIVFTFWPKLELSRSKLKNKIVTSLSKHDLSGNQVLLL